VYIDQISQSTADILLLPISENKRPHFEILLTVSILTFSLLSACDSKFYANWMIADGVITSYWFYKIWSHMYLRQETWGVWF